MHYKEANLKEQKPNNTQYKPPSSYRADRLSKE
jgi:hypothetical protein